MTVEAQAAARTIGGKFWLPTIHLKQMNQSNY